MQYIASFSGGKDSTAMVLMLLEKKEPLDRVVFIDTGLELPEMYEYINKCEKRFKELDPKLKFDRVKAEKGFEEWFYTEKKRGKNKGQIYGWPFTAAFNSWCNDRLKQRPFRTYEKQLKEQGEYIIYLGIAADEPRRLAKLEANRKAPLAEWGMTETNCLDFLKERDLYNPLYDRFKRTGCYLCPKQNLKALRTLRKYYPEQWKRMLELDKDSIVTFRANGKTLHDLEEKFKKEDSR